MTDYDALCERLDQYQKLMKHLSKLDAAGQPWTLAGKAAAAIRELWEQLAAANERAGKLNRQLVELQDAIDSRDKAAGFVEVDEITFPGRTDDTGVPMP